MAGAENADAGSTAKDCGRGGGCDHRGHAHGEHHTGGTSVRDPVCGMTVDPATPLRHEHGGTTYYFCAPSCLEKFRAAPDHYLAPKPTAPPTMAGAARGRPRKLD